MADKKIIAVVGATGAQGSGLIRAIVGFPGTDHVGNMFQFKRDFNEAFCSASNPAVARSLNPSLQTFENWLNQNRHQIPLS